jgi:hypothetical protein
MVGRFDLMEMGLTMPAGIKIVGPAGPTAESERIGALAHGVLPNQEVSETP